MSFSHQRKLMVFHWRLSDSKSPQVSRTLLSILAVFNNAVVWMVSNRSQTSKSSRPFNNPLVTVPKAPITIGIIVTYMFHSFFNSLARSRYLSVFSHSFSFILWSAGTAKSTRHAVKIKGIKTVDKYLNLERERKMQGKVGVVGTVLKTWDWGNWKSEEESRPSKSKLC